MPYIPQETRSKIDDEIDALILKIREISNQNNLHGTLNYTISRIVASTLDNEIRYKKLNDITGVLECIKLEFQRRLSYPYEDKQISKNGDVKEYKKLNME